MKTREKTTDEKERQRSQSYEKGKKHFHTINYVEKCYQTRERERERERERGGRVKKENGKELEGFTMKSNCTTNNHVN